MCDYCGDMDRKHEERYLSEGVFGKILLKYCEDNGLSTPIYADCLSLNASEQTGNYRITFEDESVEDIKFWFESKTSLDINSHEVYNKVI